MADESAVNWALVNDMLDRGKKIPAIKHYREAVGCGLREAKTAIDIREEQGRSSLLISASRRALVHSNVQEAEFKLSNARRFASAAHRDVIDQVFETLNKLMVEVGSGLGDYE